MLQTITQPCLRRKRFVPKYEVEGVYKVTLSDKTQIHTETVVGTHVYAQHPWKFISKAKIMESIDMGGELSEFFPIREQLEAYSEEEVLIGYILDESTNTDDFYICCTPEARDHCKEQSDKFHRRQEKKLEKAIYKRPKPWKSLGSDVEIMELVPVNTRDLIEIEIKTKFPMRYEPNKFDVRDTCSVRDGSVEFVAHKEKYNNVIRKRVDCASQITPTFANRVAQTQLTYPKNMWTQSIADALGQIDDTEGGGDANQVAPTVEDEVDKSSDYENKVLKQSLDEVELATYKAARTRMRRPSYVRKMNSYVTSRQCEMESVVKLNEVMDMYHNDYSNLANQIHTDTLATMTFEEYVCFTDVRAKDKYVSCATFHPMWSGIVAISYADSITNVMKTHTTIYKDPIKKAVYGLNPVLIWSHIDSLLPKLYLEAPREVMVLSFCPFNENILVGGLVSGQVVIWDLTNKLENVENIETLSEKRQKYRIAMNVHMGWMKSVDDRSVVNATVCSSLMNCHLNSVSSIKWMSPNFTVTPTGKMISTPHGQSLQFISTSVNGSILVWNMSVDNIGFVEKKKVKKSTRVARLPSGLLSDVSPFKVLDRILQPCYKIILGEAGHVWTYSIQNFSMTPPKVNYIYTPKNNGTGRKYFACEVLEQNEDEINSIFYFGSQHGTLTRATWEGHEFNTGETVNSEYASIQFRCKIHDGSIIATHKNPLVDSITLTVGGKIFAIWSDKLLGRPIIWKKRPYRLTDGAWSLYKPSILFIVNDEGALETWDLLLRSDKPISVQTLSGTMLTGVSLHTLPVAKNMIGVSDSNGSFRMFLTPPIFMLQNKSYKARMEAMIARELKVMQSFITWQDNFIKKYPHILEEIKRKEGMLLAEKEEEKRKQREELEKKHDEEVEARRLEKLKYVGPEERWQKIILKLIEKTIAVKKRINRALLIEHEKPLRELETQRLEKERRMLEIMKNQKTIFNDTVAILFPEAIKKPSKPKKSLLTDNKEALKKEYLEEYKHTKKVASKKVKKNPYRVEFRWDATLAEGKERRAALNANDDFVKMHCLRIFGESGGLASTLKYVQKDFKNEIEEGDEDSDDLS
ncbi:hypothetical protein PYW08_001819 [Mythimna loreyi]|uniref:Uncharacterized protein n=1 Tax=Mythimna loreyi TaxID=667449 RepID=A0ACC2R517_9NEOP|nr:hypothetical protein PYW08_001819 [Mythimna loreyi]